MNQSDPALREKRKSVPYSSRGILLFSFSEATYFSYIRFEK